MLIGINHVTLAVTDISKSFEFYNDILGFKPLCRWNNGAYFMVGDNWLCLNLDKKRKPSSCSTHIAFSIKDYDFYIMQNKILKEGIIPYKENTSPGDSFYFLDPDGHKLEIHVGGWLSRIEEKKKNSGTWKNVEWFI